MADPYLLVVAASSPLARRPISLADLRDVPLVGHTECRGLNRVEAQLRARGLSRSSRSGRTSTRRSRRSSAPVSARRSSPRGRGRERPADRPARAAGDPAARPRDRAAPRPPPLARRRCVRRGRPRRLRGPLAFAQARRRRRVDLDALRRALFPVRLAGARLAAGGTRLALIAVGIVAGAAVLAAVLGGRVVMEDRSLADAAAKLPPTGPHRAGRLVRRARRHVALARRRGGACDRAADRPRAGARDAVPRGADRRAPRQPARRRRPRAVGAAAVGSPAEAVQPSHCEVLRLQGAGPLPSKPALRLVEVGRATVKPDAPFAPFIVPVHTEQVARAVRYHTPQPAPVVLADGVEGLSRAPELATFFRSYAWFVPGRVRGRPPVGDRRVPAVARRAARDSRRALGPVPGDGARRSNWRRPRRRRASSRRLLLLGGEGAALLLAFTLLAALALRRHVGDARRRLVWHGARRWQVELSTFAEAAAVALAATAVGWALGAAATAVVAERAGSPAGEVVGHALVSGDGLASALAVAAAAALLLYAAVRVPAVQVGRLGLTPLDVAAGGALAVVVVGRARGSVGAYELVANGRTGHSCSSRRSSPSPPRSWLRACSRRPCARSAASADMRTRRAPARGALARGSPGRPRPRRLFPSRASGLPSSPPRTAPTLARGQSEEAAYAVPALSTSLRRTLEVVPVLHAAPAEPATRVLRLSGNVPSGRRSRCSECRRRVGSRGPAAGATTSRGRRCPSSRRASVPAGRCVSARRRCPRGRTLELPESPCAATTSRW